MAKFSKGMWWPAPDVIVDWATEVVKSEAKDDSIRCVATTKPLNHRGDALNTPTITLECSPPLPDVLLPTGYHWKAQKKSLVGPEYEIFPDVDIQKLFNIDITSHSNPAPTSLSPAPNQLLTHLGWRSVGYVKVDTSAGHPNKSLVDPDKGKHWFTFQFELAVGEKLYKLGERFGPFVKNGQNVDMWNEDGGTSSELTYKNMPFFLRTTRVNIAVPFESLSVYIVHGPSPARILERYTTLTGRPALPPAWTFGLWLSTSFTTNYDEHTVNTFLEGMEDRDIPVEVFHFDCFWMKGFQWCDFEFDKEFFPDAEGQLRRLKERGYKICVWINPYIAQESSILDEGVENGTVSFAPVKPDGSVWQWDFWQAEMAFIDFTNPKACDWYQSKLKALIDIGVDVFKTDFGERIPTTNAVYHDGSNPEKMHNYYAFLYNKYTFEIIEKTLGKHEAIVFARSTSRARRPRAVRKRFPVHWGGDPMSTFQAMAETLRGGLSLGLCGFGYWAHDIGGFEGKPDPALYKRWFAFGALSSHSHLHGSGSFRVPWLLDDSGEADRVLNKFVHVKLSLMPYVLPPTAFDTHATGVPMMRPMLLEFPEYPAAWTLDTQYMLGPSLLVTPVFNADGQVQYYVPRGRWYGVLDGRVRVGPGFVVETHDFMSVPLLLRPGGVLVRGTELGARKTAAYAYARAVRVLVNPVEGMDVEVRIPESRKPGEIAAVVRVWGGVDGVEVEVVSGRVEGRWTVQRVDHEGALKEVEVGEDVKVASV
ncbi:glycosyl hydrolases family 31-domain-containing protein [Amylostereum chailletii]|nr:glycosyl hydrolases family 31-domain-containing protein [Amylostereum chailletii]